MSAKEESIARKDIEHIHTKDVFNRMATGLSSKRSMTERGEDINNVTSLETTSQAGRRASEGALSQKLRNQDLRAVINWTTLAQWP